LNYKYIEADLAYVNYDALDPEQRKAAFPFLTDILNESLHPDIYNWRRRTFREESLRALLEQLIKEKEPAKFQTTKLFWAVMVLEFSVTCLVPVAFEIIQTLQILPFHCAKLLGYDNAVAQLEKGSSPSIHSDTSRTRCHYGLGFLNSFVIQKSANGGESPTVAIRVPKESLQLANDTSVLLSKEKTDELIFQVD
ncbi:hypothetical protein H4R33_004919, partial [Dimargaris cristalligena]